MTDRLAPLAKIDPVIAALIKRETERQEHGLELIASENFVSIAVLEAMGSPLTNKYAEGLPKKRYYGGCEVVDEVEQLAIDRAKQLFGAEHANVQPHSGAQANMAAYFAVLKHGDALMGLALPHGGHLTHGATVNFSGSWFRPVPYGVREDTGRIDYDQVRMIAKAEHPKVIVAGGSAYARIIDFPALRAIADEVGAVLMVDMAHFAGLVAGGVSPTPGPPRAIRPHYDAQDVARAPRRAGAVYRGPRQGARQAGLPRSAGRSARACDRGQGGGPGGGGGAGLPHPRRTSREQRAGARGGVTGARLCDRVEIGKASG